MKFHPYYFFILIFVFLAGCSSFQSKGFECVVYYYLSDSTGKILTDVSFYAKNEKAKLFWTTDSTISAMYFRSDSIAYVNMIRKDGWIMARDSAVVYFSSQYPHDSVIRAIPTSEQKNFSGYDCNRIDVIYKSGKKREFWVTAQFDSDICHYFAKYWDDLWENDGSDILIRKLNSDNKMIMCRKDYDKNGAFRSEKTFRKIGRRPVTSEEIEIPADVKIVHTSPPRRNNKSK